MRVGFDLDGVCYDFAESFRNYLYRAGLHNDYAVVGGEPHRWHFYRDWGMTDEEFVQHCHDGADQGIVFGDVRPRDDAASAMNFVKSIGHTTHIITDRSFGKNPGVNSSLRNTLKWLDRYGFRYDTIHFSADKTCVPTDIFVEDKLENYDALEAAGVECYLVNRPWNVDEGDSRKRIKSVQEFATIVGNMAV